MVVAAIDRLQLDSRAIAPADRYQWWQQCLTSALYPVRIEPTDSALGRFGARFTAARLDATSLTQGVVDPYVSIVTAQAARQSPTDSIQLTLNSCERQLQVGGEWIVVPAGALLAYDGSVACVHRSAARDASTMITVPRAALSLDDRQVRELQLRPLLVDAASQRVFRNAVSAVLDPSGSFPPVAAQTYLIGAADLVLRAVTGRDPDHAGTADARRQQALDYLRTRLADADLALTDVAVQLQVSPRRLQQLFAGDGGLSRVLRQLRIERATTLLGDPASAQMSVERIAAHCGFTDRSAFSRACLELTGRRPSDLRHAALRRRDERPGPVRG